MSPLVSRSALPLLTRLLALSIVGGCAQSHGPASSTSDDSPTTAAVADGSDASPDSSSAAPTHRGNDAGPPERPLARLVEAFIDSRIHTVRATCPCQVSMGAYESTDECLGFNLPPSDSAACVTKAIKPFDSPEVRETLACMTDFGENVVKCYEDLECGAPKQATCVGTLLDCFENPPQFFVPAGEECPAVIGAAEPMPFTALTDRDVPALLR